MVRKWPGFATVQYFYSVARQESIDLPLSSLSEVQKLPNETRCYVWSEEEGRWQVGRIMGIYGSEYDVHFPHRGQYLPAANIFVRCLSPIEDPTDILIYKGHETPFFHDRRFRFLRSLVEQRASARGMTGLISSRIALYSHQVEVVRRLLEDPVQRYLLADEVGLGKTIEAGIILRQFLLDDSRGVAVVAVPPMLIDQWRAELSEKFHIRLGVRVFLCGTDDVELLRSFGRADLLVIDEAHHIAEMAFSLDPALRNKFEAYRSACHRAEKLLLLSATPVAEHEREFLAMLHLLDPQNYQLSDLELFKEKVDKLQSIGQVLFGLRERARPFAIRMSLSRLRELLPADKFINSSADELELSVQEGSEEKRVQIIGAMRTHLSETYRLHQRMIRNRRSSLDPELLSTRSEDDARRVTEYDLDDTGELIHEILEEWSYAAANLALGENESGDGALRQNLLNLFMLIVQASGSWLGLLKTIVKCRLTGECSPLLVEDIGHEGTRVLRETPLIPGEQEILQTLLQKLEAAEEDEDRLSLLEEVVARIRGISDVPPKIVVFTSYSVTARAILNRLSQSLDERSLAGYGRGMAAKEVEESVRRFQHDNKCYLLVCDRSGEEGRNLQFADWIIHFDLPWYPNRVEQRIGRLDRIGRSGPLRWKAFLGPESEDSMHDAWFKVLKDGFGVFDDSVAGLQFYIDRKVPELYAVAFQQGAQGLTGSIEQIRSEIQAEQRKIDEQSALDGIDAGDSGTASFIEGLERYDVKFKEMQAATETWVCDVLNFKRVQDTLARLTVQYTPTTRTLVPIDILSRQLSPHINRAGTYSRIAAINNPTIRFFRLGDEGFIDSMADYIGWDDRGQSFALWRVLSGWDPGEGGEWVGFRLNYVIEADTKLAQRTLGRFGLQGSDRKALLRRADAFFPPMVETIFIDASLRPVTNERMIKILEKPFSKDGAAEGYKDYNLAKDRLAVLDEVIAPDLWAGICQSVRDASERLLRERTAFQELCELRAAQARRDLETRVNRLRVRLGYESEHGGTLRAAVDRDFRLEESLMSPLVEGIRHPRIKLDSVGLIVISGRQPSI